MSEDLRLIVFDNIETIGKKVNEEIKKMRGEKTDYIVPIKIDRFSNGEAKASILSTVRDKDIYILTDVGNYSLTYKMHGMINHYSPDDHYADLKRIILAMCGHAKKITLVMPLMYEARQHRKKGRESLDCAYALEELMSLGVKEVITFDVHDPNVANAVPLLAFENFYATNEILEEIIKNEDINRENLLVISPDQGAMDRAKTFTDILEVDTGVFYKRRDTSKVVNGKNPIVEHIYMGPEIEGKNIIVVDDMVASGGSILDVGRMLKERGANKVLFVATFGLFTEGVEKFDNARNAGIFDKMYTTNLTYIPNEYEKKEWLNIVDCSQRIAEIIDYIHKGKSLTNIVHGNSKVLKLLKENR